MSLAIRRFSQSVWPAGAFLCISFALPQLGCHSQQAATDPRPATSTSVEVASVAWEETTLEGRFERVARAVTGTASIVRRGADFELVLREVTVSQQGTVRVYLVGHDWASTTRILDETEMKYDMAELERGALEQRIALPSEPDPRLRSVVLFYPEFGVNIAVAPLRPKRKAPSHQTPPPR